MVRDVRGTPQREPIQAMCIVSCGHTPRKKSERSGKCVGTIIIISPSTTVHVNTHKQCIKNMSTGFLWSRTKRVRYCISSFLAM